MSTAPVQAEQAKYHRASWRSRVATSHLSSFRKRLKREQLFSNWQQALHQSWLFIFQIVWSSPKL